MPVLDDPRNTTFAAASDMQDSGEPQSPDNNQSTALEPEPARNAHPEPELPSNCGTNTLDLALDANNTENQTTSRLAPRKMDAALALSVGETETEVARLLGVNRTTLYRWQQEAEFVAEVNRLKREYLAAQRVRLTRLLHLAIGTMETCLERPDLVDGLLPIGGGVHRARLACRCRRDGRWSSRWRAAIRRARRRS